MGLFADALELSQKESELEPDVVVRGQQFKVSLQPLINARYLSTCSVTYDYTS